MLWPFGYFRKTRAPSRCTIEAIYGMIVAQAREPLFYQALGVPDTVDGRFDMVLLHLWMVLRQLRSGPDEALRQALFDHFCSDMDANLREMGVGDLTVPKRMQKFGEAFYGRSTAYDAALATGHEALTQALCKNVLNGTRLEQARQLAVYVEATLTDLSARDEADIVSGKWRFVPLPAPAQ